MILSRKFAIYLLIIFLFLSCNEWTFAVDKGVITIALLHLDLRMDDVEYNRNLIESAIEIAQYHGADWIITPELAESGFEFVKVIGLSWVDPFPTQWVHYLMTLAKQNDVTLIIGLPEREKETGKFYNSLVVIDDAGRLLGTYRKIKVVKVAESEKWAEAGDETKIFTLNGVKVGLLICADAYWPEVAAQYRGKVNILLSGANWPPGECGPDGEWEARSQENQLPLLVCNRTGREVTMDFTQGESVVVDNGKRLYTLISPDSSVFLIDWDRKNGTFRLTDALGVEDNCRRVPVKVEK